jgi:hypothetical protein
MSSLALTFWSSAFDSNDAALCSAPARPQRLVPCRPGKAQRCESCESCLWGLAPRDRKWPLNDEKIPNLNVVRVALGTGYHRVAGNRRTSRNGRVSDLPPEITNREVTIRNNGQVERTLPRVLCRKRQRDEERRGGGGVRVRGDKREERREKRQGQVERTLPRVLCRKRQRDEERRGGGGVRVRGDKREERREKRQGQVERTLPRVLCRKRQRDEERRGGGGVRVRGERGVVRTPGPRLAPRPAALALRCRHLAKGFTHTWLG